MSVAIDLEQTVCCPSCGWEHRTVDSADGLHAINRRCQRMDCKTYFLSIFRGADRVDTVELGGTDSESYRAALEAVTELTDGERKRLMLTARDRALRLS